MRHNPGRKVTEAHLVNAKMRIGGDPALRTDRTWTRGEQVVLQCGLSPYGAGIVLAGNLVNFMRKRESCSGN